MTDPQPAPASPTLVVDDEARTLARRLVRTARHGALGWLEPGTGAPMTSRVALSVDFDGSPILLLSQLSAHTRALAADPRLSILVGEAGDGDPMNQPRLSIAGTAVPVSRDAADRERLAGRFIARHASAAHYSSFADFGFFRMDVRSGFLNAGFARAYPLTASDIMDDPSAEMAACETRVVSHMNDDHADVLDRLMARRGAASGGWRIATLDRRGFEVVDGRAIERIEFDAPVDTPTGFRQAFVSLALSLEG